MRFAFHRAQFLWKQVRLFSPCRELDGNGEAIQHVLDEDRKTCSGHSDRLSGLRWCDTCSICLCYPSLHHLTVRSGHQLFELVGKSLSYKELLALILYLLFPALSISPLRTFTHLKLFLIHLGHLRRIISLNDVMFLRPLKACSL